MKKIFRLLTGLLAAVISFAAVGAVSFADDSDPYLGLDAVCANAAASSLTVTEGHSYNISVTTYIPIENFKNFLPDPETGEYDIGIFSPSSIMATASANKSFIPRITTADISIEPDGGFLCVKSKFDNVYYCGTGSEFTYTFYYVSKGKAVSKSFTTYIAGCIETEKPQEPEEEPVPSFTLSSGTSYELRAGTSSYISFGFNTIGTGKFSVMTASLSSSDSNVVVNDASEKSSSSFSPYFSFRITVPQMTPAGVYNLTLTTHVYNTKGASAKSSTYTIPITVTNNIKTAGLSVSSFKASKDDIKPGDKFKLTLTLKNECGIDIQDAIVAIDEQLDAKKFVLDGGFSKQSVNIRNGSTANVTFAFIACDGISSVRETINVKTTYRINPSKADTEQSLATSVVLSCSPREEEKKVEYGKFAVTMTDYKIDKDAVKDGTKFRLSVTIENKGDLDIKGIHLSFPELDGTKFAANGGVSYADFDLAKGKSKVLSFNLVGCAGIKSIREALKINLDYGGSKENAVTNTVIAYIPCEINEESKIEYGKFDITMTDYSIDTAAVKQGTKFRLNVTIENKGDNDAKGIHLSFPELDGTKFAANGGASFVDFDLAKGKSKKFTFNLVGCEGIKSIREALKINLDYGAGKENAVTNTVIAYIPCDVSGASWVEYGKFDITMTNYSISTDAVTEGTWFTLGVDIENKGNVDVKGIHLSFPELDGTKFAANGGVAYEDFDLAKGQQKHFSFNLVGCEGIKSIREAIKINLDYGSGKENAVTNTVTAYIPCIPKESAVDPEKGELFAPDIIIDSYNYGGDYVTAGTTFPLNIVIENTSSTSVIENLKVTLNGQASGSDGKIAFSPANSSNSFFFEVLGPKEKKEINIDFLASADVNPNSYPIDVSFSFQFVEGSKKGSSKDGLKEVINIPVQQEDRLTLGEVSLPEMSYVYQPASISVPIINKGKTTCNNVSGEISGEGFTCDSSSYYIGNIDKGSEDSYDVTITPIESGRISGEIRISYEDANGRENEKIVPFSFNSEEMPAMDFGPMEEEPMEEETGTPVWVWFAVGGGAAIAVLIAVIVIVKKAKKRKEIKELEDDDEDI